MCTINDITFRAPPCIFDSCMSRRYSIEKIMQNMKCVAYQRGNYSLIMFLCYGIIS